MDTFKLLYCSVSVLRCAVAEGVSRVGALVVAMVVGKVLAVCNSKDNNDEGQPQIELHPSKSKARITLSRNNLFRSAAAGELSNHSSNL